LIKTNCNKKIMITITRQVYNETIDLPINEKICLVDKLLTDISPIDPIIEKDWILESENRLKEYRNGKVKSISGEEVFNKIKKKLNHAL